LASVIIARRLCDSGGAGAIRASDIVVRLLDARQGDRGSDIRTKDLGPLDLKGITNPVPAVEIVYEHDPMALLRKLPFVGRHDEYEAMLKKLAEARNSRGSVNLLAGEPGIGKTRLTENSATASSARPCGNCWGRRHGAVRLDRGAAFAHRATPTSTCVTARARRQTSLRWFPILSAA
jgi:hypothetical protein